MADDEDPVWRMYEAQAIILEKRIEIDELMKKYPKELKKFEEMKDDETVSSSNDARIEISYSAIGNTKDAVDSIIKGLDNLHEMFFKLSTKVNGFEVKLKTVTEKVEQFELSHKNLNKKVEDYIESKENNKQVLVLGGVSNNIETNDILLFDYLTKKWKKLSIQLPAKLMRHGSIVLKNEIYIFGGDVNMRTSNTVFKWSPLLGNSWQKLNDMKEKRTEITNSSVVLDEFIWVVGGNDGEKALKTVERYDPITNSWKWTPDMAIARAGAIVVEIKEKIFVCGGSGSNESFIEIYDPKAQIWSKFCKLSFSSEFGAALSLDDHLVLLGKRQMKKITVEGFERNWISMPDMKKIRFGFTAHLVGSRIMAIGGQNEDSVEFFDGNEWTEGLKMPTTRLFHSSLVIAGELVEHLSKLAK